MLIKQVMSHALKTIEEDATMLAASNMMKVNNIRHLPVTNKEGQIVGILSDRDIQRASTVTHNHTGKSIYIQEFKKVSEFMTSPVHTVLENEEVDKVVREMLELKVSCFLVKKESKITGIVTSDDFLLFLLDILGKEKRPFALKRLKKALHLEDDS